MVDRRYVLVENRRGTRMPFSKGLCVSSVMVTGIRSEAAYRVAEAVEDRLLAAGVDAIRVEQLISIIDEEIACRFGELAASTWSTWVAARRTGQPILVFIGGVTGTGKSTVATRLAAPLGISRVVATDAVREVMRGSFPETVLPVIHVSSFEAHETLRAPLPADEDPVLAGFRQQSEIVASGLRRLIERALVEGTDLIVEGAHLVPGIFGKDMARWRRTVPISEMVLTVSDPDTHRGHFMARQEHSVVRRPSRYLEHFDAIRRMHRYVTQQAQANGVPRIEVDELDEVVQHASSMVVDEVIARHRTGHQTGAESLGAGAPVDRTGIPARS